MAATDAILDAAEEIFGTHGFDGGNLREIAKVAGVSQALLHYHHDNKDALYEAVFERRAEAIRSVRHERLAALLSQGEHLDIESVLGVLFVSLDRLLNVRRGNLRYYVQMLAEVTVRGDERSIRIVKKYYDPTANTFIDAFMRALPELSREKAVWAYLFAIGGRLQVHSPSGRVQRLGRGGRLSSTDGYQFLVTFVAAGIRALVVEAPAYPEVSE
ncbi:MAG: TetR family transcriptional regulator [Oleispira sp.]|nr:TetR family transcriptional regulator [Oleispira sp.]